MAEQAQEDTPSSRDLNAAIAACFSTQPGPPSFPERLVELTRALTNTRHASVWEMGAEGWTPVARSGPMTDIATTATFLADNAAELSEDSASARFASGRMIARIALPGGQTGLLLMEQPSGAAAVQGLSYERLSMLAQLSFAQFRNAGLRNRDQLAADIQALAGGDTTRLKTIADQIAGQTGADIAAAGLFDGSTITDLALSGQDGFAPRAELPKRLRGQLAETARLGTIAPDQVFARMPGRDTGLVLLTEGGAPPAGLLPMAAALYAQANHGKPPSRWTARRLVRLGAAALVLFGLAMVPIPDGVDLPARVAAQNTRVITAPFTGVIDTVNVSENARVEAGQPLVQMDTRTLELDLIGLLAERANAVIERETARAGRNAAQLRNAELEVDRLQAQIDLLEARKQSATLGAGISGIALLDDLPNRVGATVRQGDRLLEVADPTSLWLELTVLESSVAKIAAGDTGTFRPDFDPTLSVPARITFISPAIDLQQDPPQLMARAVFDPHPDTLGPGLSGVLIIGDTYRPVWQVAYTNLRNWVLLRFLL